MKHSTYMASAETQQLMWISAMRQMLEIIIETTQDKAWLRKFKTCDTYLKTIIDERLNDLEKMECEKFMRRIKNIHIKVAATDDFRVEKDDWEKACTIRKDDLFELVDIALHHCFLCKQGDLVKDCPRRKLLHRLGMNVHAARENPAPGECEFRHDNEVRAVNPQHERMEEELICHLP